MTEYVSAIGQDSHRFVGVECDLSQHQSPELDLKPLMLAGVLIEGFPGLEGNSDADVIIHSLVNAISGISCVNILGEITDNMCLKQKITDSRQYLNEALATLGEYRLTHISFSVECKKPHLSKYIEVMRKSIADMAGISTISVGITITSGEGLTDFGRGLGIQVLCIITAMREIK